MSSQLLPPEAGVYLKFWGSALGIRVALLVDDSALLRRLGVALVGENIPGVSTGAGGGSAGVYDAPRVEDLPRAGVLLSV